MTSRSTAKRTGCIACFTGSCCSPQSEPGAHSWYLIVELAVSGTQQPREPSSNSNELQFSWTVVSQALPLDGGGILHAASHIPAKGLPALSVQPMHAPTTWGSGSEPHATRK